VCVCVCVRIIYYIYIPSNGLVNRPRKKHIAYGPQRVHPVHMSSSMQDVCDPRRAWEDEEALRGDRVPDANWQAR